MGTATRDSVLLFGTFELDVNKGQLRKSGVRLKLRPQAFRVLALLASRSGDVVTREEIRKEIWNGDLVVDFDQGLNFCIRQIRSALGDNADTPRFIETIPRRGYQFLVPVQTLEPPVQTETAPLADTTPEPVRAWRTLLLVCLGVFAVAALMYLAFVNFGRSDQRQTAGSQVRSIAVLPLANLSGDSKQEFFADGMTEALIDRLSTLRNVRVVSRTSVMQFKQSRKPVPEIAKQLNVDALVEGAVVHSGDRVRISVRLINGGTERNIWSNVYDRKTSDVLALQTEVARAITGQIQGQLVGQSAGLRAATRTVAPNVYESYLKGRFQLNRGDRTSVAESAKYFEQAIAGDPTFAPAYSSLALAYTVFGRTTTAVSPVADALPKAYAAARKALELDPNMVEAHAVLAQALEQDWRWAEAETEYRRALDVDPNNALSMRYFGELLAIRMRTEEGLALAKRARQLDPLTLNHTARLGWQLYHARRYDEAARELRVALSMDPNHRLSLWYLGFVLIEKKQFEEAIRVLEQAASQSGRNPAELGVLARAYAQGGRRPEALHIVDELIRQRRDTYVTPSIFVHAYIGLGDYDKAFVWLERAFEEHSNIIRYLRTHPAFDPMRGDRRFQDLLRRSGI